jgi:uncharacterized damage-inducible protein DinB
VNGALLEAFRHNAWATKELLAFCRTLPQDKLTHAATGTYGDILATFSHIVRADTRYLRRLAGGGFQWADSEEVVDLATLELRAAETAAGWERLLSEPIDADRLMVLDEGAYETHAGVIVAQALHHGNAHREQICAIVTGFGGQPPDIQAWTYAQATGRARERAQQD